VTAESDCPFVKIEARLTVHENVELPWRLLLELIDIVALLLKLGESFEVIEDLFHEYSNYHFNLFSSISTPVRFVTFLTFLFIKAPNNSANTDTIGIMYIIASKNFDSGVFIERIIFIGNKL